MPGMIPPDLSLAATAHWTAAARAQESARPDALFQDPWALALAGDEGARWLAGLGSSAFGTAPMVIRTRFFDAMSLIFPPGEKFFMVTVRDYRDQVTDPKLLQDIKDFNRQEAQHSMVHNQYNDLLRKQGMPVDELIGWLD